MDQPTEYVLRAEELKLFSELQAAASDIQAQTRGAMLVLLRQHNASADGQWAIQGDKLVRTDAPKQESNPALPPPVAANENTRSFTPHTIEEGIESVVGSSNGLTAAVRMRDETPLFAKAILRNLPKGCTEILDYGCGIGRLAKELLDQNSSLTILGADTSTEELGLATAYVSNGRFSICHPLEINQQFRLIYCIYVLQHVASADLQFVVQNLYSKLSDDGVLIYCSAETSGVREELAKSFDEVGPLFLEAEIKANEILRKMIAGEGGCTHPAVVYRRRYVAGPAIRQALVALEANLALDVIRYASQAIKDGDHSSSAYVLKAASLGDLGRRGEALDVLKEAFEKVPAFDHVPLYQQRGFERILSGDFGGWEDWEYRQQRADVTANFAKNWPEIQEWDGSSDRTIWVNGEKGLGDTILFARYLSVLKDRNCTVQFVASPASAPFVDVIRGYPGVHGAYGPSDAVPKLATHWISLESLPKYALKMVPPPFKLPMQWKSGIRSDPFRVGLCWHGATGYAAAKSRRPEDPKLWKVITKIPGIEFISLQLGEKGDCCMELPADSSLLDTLKAACSCDLVIVIDTSVAHLAASAGVPTWVPLHRLNYWPWIMTPDDKHTVWYPSMQIFRQHIEWVDVFEQMATKLAKLANPDRKSIV